MDVKIKILADSTADLDAELKKKYDITSVPLYVVLGDNTYLDGVNITQSELFKWATDNKKTPKTAAPGIANMTDIMKEYVDQGYTIIYFGISEHMSSSCNVARLAAKELKFDRLHVIDSKNLSLGIGLQVIRAAEMVREGLSAEEIVSRINGDRDKLRVSFVIDTLTYLYYGGRCTALTLMMANTLNLKPKIIVSNGEMSVGKKYRGNVARVSMNYVADLEPELRRAHPSRGFIVHTMQPEYMYLVDEVKKYLTGLGVFDEILIARAGCVISSHCGPNTMSLMFYSK